jgi:magnesium-transporting ATPase (P-type)
MTAQCAKVRREGKVASIPASEIAAGDIIELEAGDLVAADANSSANAWMAFSKWRSNRK